MKKKKLKKERRKKNMSTPSDSAEEIVKLSLEGFEVIARLTGSMAKEMAVLLYAMTKESKKKTKGQTRLNNLLKSNSNLRIFTIKKEDFQDFKKQTKRYGVLYSALYKKGEVNKDGVIDILVREEDAVRVNRIIERFELTTVDQTKVETELEKAEVQKIIPPEEKAEIQEEIQKRNTSEDLLNKLLNRQNIKEENDNTNPSSISNTDKEIQLENLSKMNEKMEEIKNEEKPSIKEQINNIKKENEEKERQKQEPKEIAKKEKTKQTMHKHPKKKNRKKERGK